VKSTENLMLTYLPYVFTKSVNDTTLCDKVCQ